MLLASAWQYYHSHLQDNVNASGVTFILGYMMGLHRHFKRIHRHLYEQDAKTTLMHKHIKEIHRKVHQ